MEIGEEEINWDFWDWDFMDDWNGVWDWWVIYESWVHYG